ncbi:MAG: DUF4062 domain-containing protein [Candidatus Aminicenantes bacterium]|nr:DUF4062 domain-containing protein [Candidatus Aminicenantes bacterium]
MDRKYQVFVSSTYEDLQKERQEVMHVLLELDCIPSGMELFPAADEDQWSLIKGVIDDCDYYIVIIAGRYGSVGADGVSYTEMEYRYAVANGKPVAAFLHSDPGSIPRKYTETTDEGTAKLQAFRELVQQKMCKNWGTPHELGSVVARSLNQLRKKHPGVGWVRGDQVPEREATAEILDLRKQIEQLENSLQEIRVKAPPGTEHLAQGNDSFGILCQVKWWDPPGFRRRSLTTSLSWNQIFYTVSPLLIHEAAEGAMSRALEDQLLPKVRDQITELQMKLGLDNAKFSISSESFRTIIVQLRALGLIGKSTRTRSVKDRAKYWTLTPFGDNVMTRLRAITRAG